MSVSTSAGSSSEYQDGLAFRFKLPKGTKFSLRGVEIKDGQIILIFSTSDRVPSISEEDVATCARLCRDGKRPEFFYKQILPLHPFAATERWYKEYKPPYLKNTSVGELYAEADWKMKCLNAGVKSDEAKERFSSWSKFSKVEGFATVEKFPAEEKSGQVLMTCQSVDVSEGENELIFVGEPKMQITYTSSPSYTEDITEKFDSIAYHDEPSFLKMKEIVKLMLALEWLRDRGVQFSEEWIKEHTNQQESRPRKPVQLNLSDEEKNDILEQVREEIDSALEKLPKILDLPSTGTELAIPKPKLSLQVVEKKATKTGIKFTLESTRNDPTFKALTDLDLPVETRAVFRVTIDDYDFLFEGADSNMPITIDEDEGLVRPGVSSWSELFAELMPIPSKKVEDSSETRAEIITGGCTSANIPVNKVPYPTTCPIVTAQVGGSKSRKRTKVVPSASHKHRECPPSRDNRSGSSTALEMRGGSETFGWTDGGSSTFSSSDGKETQQSPSLHGIIEIQQLIGGQEVGEPLLLHKYLRCPSKRDSHDSAYSSMRSITDTC